MDHDIDLLLDEYRLAQAYSMRLVTGLDDAQLAWRPHADSSSIAWHLGHHAAVNHYLVRNLTAAEVSFDQDLDRLFDSATPEPDRGGVPPLARIVEYREAIAGSTERVMRRIRDGDVGAPAQLGLVARGLLVAVINHEYQHDQWISEVREELVGPALHPPPSDRCTTIDGYWVLTG